jgi:hypothetical protein
MRVFGLAILVTFIGTSAATAFTTTSGFGASVYASGVTPTTAPAGLAFIGTTLYAVDPADGGLYRVPAGASPLTFTRVATIGTSPTGIAALGGALYVTLASGDLVRVDPASGAVLATVATASDIPCMNAVAADPVTGDLFVTSCDWLWRVASPAAAPAITRYTQLFPGGAATYGITIAADGTIFVAAPSFGQIWRVQGPTQAAGSPPLRGVVAYAASPRGLALVSTFLFINGADGTITKAPLPEVGGAPVVALTGGDAGDLETLGPDGCVYASQGAAVIRLGDDHGGCDLVHAAPPPPPPSLTLVNVSTSPPLVGGGDQSFTAALANVASPGNVSVTFTVTGANPVARPETTAPNGVASFAYSATHTGTDTIVATASVGGTTVTSNALTVIWPRAFDTTPPTIRYAVVGTHGATFGCPKLDVGQIGVLEYCGWFTSPPTLTWTVTTSGASGIDLVRTNCPTFTLLGNSPIGGTPVTCIAYNGDGISSSLQVRLQASASPPSIVPSAVNATGTYVPGTPSASPVTVTFACTSALGAEGITSCTAPVTLSDDGSTSLTGTVTDVTGTTRTATFGPIVIDRTGPVVTISASAGGHDYAPGTPTVSDVTVTFACSDAPAGVLVCPEPVLVNTAGTKNVTRTASDTLGNTTLATFGPIVIDRSGPSVTASVTPTPDAGGNVPLSGTVNITATDPSGVASITYSATGAQTIAATPVSGATAHATITAIGTTTVSFFATDTLGNVGATGHIDVHVISTQTSTTTITSAPFLGSGATTASAKLVGMDGVSPAVGKTITFSAGVSTATGVTDATGVATASLALAPGAYTLTATFAGDTAYFPSGATQQLIVYAPARFVVYSPNATPGAVVQFYGGDWSRQIADKDARKGFSDFKGYAENVFDASWNARSGDAVKPPKTIPQYIGVILTTSASKTKDVITGDNAGIAIVKVMGGDEDPDKGKKDRPYDGKLGDRGFGTVLGFVRR